MQQRKEINHSFGVAVFARWRLGIPQTLDDRLGVGSGVGEGEGTNGIGSCHTARVVAKGIAAVEGEMAVGEVVGLEEAEQPSHSVSLTLLVLPPKVVVHTYVHGAAYGIIHVYRRVVGGMRPTVRRAVIVAVVRIEACRRVGRVDEMPACRLSRLFPELAVLLSHLCPVVEEGRQLV